MMASLELGQKFSLVASDKQAINEYIMNREWFYHT